MEGKAFDSRAGKTNKRNEMKKILRGIVWFLSKITFGAIPEMKKQDGPGNPTEKPPGSGG